MALVKIIGDREMESKRKLISSFEIFFFCDQFSNQHGKMASKEL